MPCVYLPGPAPTVTVANNDKHLHKVSWILKGSGIFLHMVPFLKVSGTLLNKIPS